MLQVRFLWIYIFPVLPSHQQVFSYMVIYERGSRVRAPCTLVHARLPVKTGVVNSWKVSRIILGSTPGCGKMSPRSSFQEVLESFKAESCSRLYLHAHVSAGSSVAVLRAAAVEWGDLVLLAISHSLFRFYLAKIALCCRHSN
jgi:hypothetical protein